VVLTKNTMNLFYCLSYLIKRKNHLLSIHTRDILCNSRIGTRQPPAADSIHVDSPVDCPPHGLSSVCLSFS
jgi:hypothetical protein